MPANRTAQLFGLRKAFQATRAGHASALGVARTAPVVLSYVGLLILINLYGVVQLGPLAFAEESWLALHLGFYRFWQGTAGSGFSMLTAVMVCNSLMAVYLWVGFRTEGRSEIGKRLFFLAGGVVLVTLLRLYWTLVSQRPPPVHLLPFPT
ncbi:MAG: hypothetical protein AAGF23_21600 [Acidobacteriota bacterium]